MTVSHWHAGVGGPYRCTSTGCPGPQPWETPICSGVGTGAPDPDRPPLCGAELGSWRVSRFANGGRPCELPAGHDGPHGYPDDRWIVAPVLPLGTPPGARERARTQELGGLGKGYVTRRVVKISPEPAQLERAKQQREYRRLIARELVNLEQPVIVRIFRLAGEPLPNGFVKGVRVGPVLVAEVEFHHPHDELLADVDALRAARWRREPNAAYIVVMVTRTGDGWWWASNGDDVERQMTRGDCLGELARR